MHCDIDDPSDARTRECGCDGDDVDADDLADACSWFSGLR